MYVHLHTPPAKILRSGIVDVGASPDTISVTDCPAGALRWIMQEGPRPATPNGAKTRLNALLAAGIHPLVCVGDSGYSSATNLANDVWTILSGATNTNGLWIEMINEPGQSANTPQVNRDNYLARIFGVATSGNAIGKSPLDVAHAFGVKTLLSAITGVSGSLGPMLDDLEAGHSGADPAKIDGCVLHSYDVEPPDVIANYVSGQNQMDAHPGMAGKPFIASEIGWCCAYRADGFQHGDWDPGVPNWTNGAGSTVNRTIDLAEQAGKIARGPGGLGALGLWELIAARPDLRCEGMYWFCGEDYGLPTGQHYQHCGAKDIGGNERPAWQRLSVQPDVLATAHRY